MWASLASCSPGNMNLQGFAIAQPIAGRVTCVTKEDKHKSTEEISQISVSISPKWFRLKH